MKTNPLDNIKVASPCPADWNAMVGNEQVRFCQQCNLNVYNLSGMNKTAAEDLIRKTEGRLCVRFYQRNDGTVITENCPVGLQAVKQRLTRIATATISALLGFLGGIGVYAGWNSSSSPVRYPIQGNIARPLNNNVPPPRAIMGDVAVSTPTTPSTETPSTTPGCKLKSAPLPVLNQPVMGRIAYRPPTAQK